MITVNCPKCGAQADIDEKHEESVVCKHCKTVITLEKAAPEKYKELIEKREKTEQRYKNILKDYEGGNDAPLKNAMHKVISNTDTDDFNINRWFDFIFDAVNIGIKKKDTTNLEILKAHARRFDDAYSDYNASDRRLYDSLVFLHPEILNESEWKVEFEKAKASKADETLLQNNILKCVKEKKDPKLLINVLNVLANSPDDFKGIGEEFLNNILDDEDIAKILSIQFFKKARGGNFAKKLKRYVSGTFKEAEVILKDTLVWNNAEKVQKQKKNKRIIIISSVLAVAAAAVLVFMLIKNGIVMSSIELEKPSGNSAIIKMVYGDSPDLSGYKVIYEERDGTKQEDEVTPEMLSGYDKEKIGTQAAKITYKGKTFDVNIEVLPRQLEKTTVSIADNKLVWDRVANAEGYDIYLSKTPSAVGAPKYRTIEDPKGNTTLVFDLTNVNDMEEVFYATVVAYNTTDKYIDSEKSNEIKITKLLKAEGIRYDKDTNKLKWNAVIGADRYTIMINDAQPIRDIRATEITLANGLMLGNNDITVTAYPAEQNVIMSESKASIYMLSKVHSLEYLDTEISWKSEGKTGYYNIYIDGAFSHEQSGTTLDVSLWTAGNYTVGIEEVSKSDTIVTSECETFKVYVGTKLTVADGKIDWSVLGGTKFNVYVNGVRVASETNEKYKNISDLITEAVTPHKVYIEVVNGGISETVTVKKLAAPVIYIQNQTLKVNGPVDNYKFTVDGNPFTGEYTEIIDTLTAAGEHTITAVNKAVANNEIDSDAVTLTVTRLAAPVISVSGGELYANDVLFDGTNTSVKWYYDNDNSISAPSFISVGEHTVYAKAIAVGENQLDSAESNRLTVTKLPKPVLSYSDGDTEVTCETATVPGSELKYYRNGQLWNGDMSTLNGTNSITARFETNSADLLNSEFSLSITIIKTNVKAEAKNQGSDNIVVYLTDGDPSLQYEIDIKWYNAAGSLVREVNKPKTSFNDDGTSKPTFTKLGASAEITVKVYDDKGNLVDTVPETWG